MNILKKLFSKRENNNCRSCGGADSHESNCAYQKGWNEAEAKMLKNSTQIPSDIKQLEKDSELGRLIAKLGHGTGNSDFVLHGNFMHDFGWEAIWVDLLNIETQEKKEYKTWENTPEEAVRVLIAKRKNDQKTKQ